MDKIDKAILAALQSDATLTVERIAKRVGVTTTPCWRRIQKLEESGVLLGRVAIVDPQKVGISTMAFVSIKAPEHAANWTQDILKAIEEYPEILEAHRTSGDVDYVLKVAVGDLEAYHHFHDAFCQRLGIRTTSVQFSMQTLKWTTQVPLGHLPARP